VTRLIRVEPAAAPLRCTGGLPAGLVRCWRRAWSRIPRAAAKFNHAQDVKAYTKNGREWMQVSAGRAPKKHW